jgi:thiamine kinase-like enzyme
MSSTRTARAISAHIRDNVYRYFPSLEGTEVNVRLLEEQQRVVSALYRFEISSPAKHYYVFAKGTPLSGNPDCHNTPVVQRARLVPPLTDYGKRLQLEYTALAAIHDHFEQLGNPCFGTIRILDFLEDSQTILMEENRDPNLLSRFAKANRLRYPFRDTPDLREAFFNSGAWLKEYSTLPNTGNVTPRNTSREDYINSIVNFTGFLEKIVGNTSLFRQVADTAVNAASRVLPEKLPLALGHGDYAMRNILVGVNNRITIIDTNSKWQVPIYEDIAYFLIRLETNKLQVFTQGMAISPENQAGYQREFLSGYFGQSPVPERIIELFRIQSLLDNWSSRASVLAQQPTGRKSLYRKFHLALLNRHYRKIMERLLQDAR